jgi:hypothetical protein
MKIYKGIPKKLNVVLEKTANNITYVLVNGYKNKKKVVGYSNTSPFNGNFISYTTTQFKNIELALTWINSK